jgi:hypothetical protein
VVKRFRNRSIERLLGQVEAVLLPWNMPEVRKGFASLSLLAVTALVALCFVSIRHGGNIRTELASRSRGRLQAEKDVLQEAHHAHSAITSMIQKLQSPDHPATWQRKGLLREAKNTLEAVQKLEGLDDAAAPEESGSSHSKIASKVDIQLSADLPLKDDAAIRDELHKLKETAERVRREMRHMRQEESTDRVQTASKQVEKDNASLEVRMPS